MSATQTIEITCEMQILTCWKCGAIFAVNKPWYLARAKGNCEPICCPKGHEVTFVQTCEGRTFLEQIELTDAAKVSALEATARANELRQRLTRVLHVLDQHNLPDPTAPADDTTEETAAIEGARALMAVGKTWLDACSVEGERRMRCPKCGTSYASPNWMVRHLRKQHQIDPYAPFVEAPKDAA